MLHSMIMLRGPCSNCVGTVVLIWALLSLHDIYQQPLSQLCGMAMFGTAESPAIIADQDIVTAETRQMVTLSVHISTFLGPLPANQLQITWYLPGGPALNANDTRIEGHVTGSSLVVANVTADSVGKYSCTVEQSRDSVTYNSSTSIDLRLFSESAHTQAKPVISIVNSICFMKGVGVR